MCVLLYLIAGLKGNNITCDNFFTSQELAMQLLKKKLTILGTRANVHSLKFVPIEECTAVSYIPKMHRIAVLFSTMHKVHKDGSLMKVN
ncbi:hypothetical protein T07_4299 [Trichinella nelsoni]|uniref:PiggyBac transposable element-derived protein domain-containing protein n=1 Tax=Trichinella nelsoni TaxID=6336 RepID=A0A0V0SPB7_9BILA|nr:hypothetical protein T07_4299 [Trichinella nelsoni]